MNKVLLTVVAIASAVLYHERTFAQECVDCHEKVTPNIVTDWQVSKHSQNGVECATCHGDQHTSAADVAKVQSHPETCATCHETQFNQFKSGKHSAAWAAMKAMPTADWQPMALMEGMKGCGGCHKIGLKTDGEIKDLKKSGAGFGVASCDACHTRHTFSVKEATQPQACQTCHMGFDHPQWEMYSGSKHGVRYLLKQNGTLPENVAAPTCQTCHMQEGNHAVRTAWGFLAVRLPLPEDKQWAADQATILQALGVLDPSGKPTARFDIVKAADVARLTQEDWQKERDKMLKTCNQCHSMNFAVGELQKGDQMIKESDRLLAAAIRTVAGLYKDGILQKPKSYAYAFPDLSCIPRRTDRDRTKTVCHASRAAHASVQGTFHANPDYSNWYGWSEMQRSLSEIKEMAADERAKHRKK